MSVISGIAGAVASDKAADTQAEAGDRATQAQLEMFYKSREDTAPWREAGKWALNALVGTPGTPAQTVTTSTPAAAAGTGNGYWVEDKPIIGYHTEMGETGGVSVPTYGPAVKRWVPAAGSQNALETSTSTIPATPGTPGLIVPDPGKNFTKSPGYDFRLTEGLNALDKSMVAKGRVGGAQLKAVTEYGQDYASNEYDKFLNQYYQSLNPYLSLAGMGQVSAGNASNAAIATGSNIADNALYQGNARASGYINQANALKGASNSAIEGYAAYKKYSTPSTLSAWDTAAATYGGGWYA